MPAALATECAHEQGKFWEMHDIVFENAKALEDGQLESYAQKIGLDMGRYKQCYASQKYKERVLKDQSTAVNLGARGTPAFFINGRYLSGAQPYQSFASIIDQELEKAKNSGVSKRDYYEKQVVEKGEKR